MIADLVHNKVTWTRYRQRRKCEDKELVERQAGIFLERVLGAFKGLKKKRNTGNWRYRD